MIKRRSLSWPIILGSTMIVLLIALIVFWVLLSIFGVRSASPFTGVFLTLLPLGVTFLALVLAGVVFYLVLSIKAVNLNRRQSNFIDSVTHELKSPIASLKLYLQTLTRRPLSAQEQGDFLKIMLDDVERLDQLINHLLDTARLSKSEALAEPMEIDLAALLRHCGNMVAFRFHAPENAIEYRLAPCTILAVQADVEMIFRNLLDNAVKYAGQPPQVLVELLPPENGEVLVRVSDNGRGVPPHLRKRIFARFERLGLELEREKPGTGLGLYIVNTLVRRLRGRVQVVDSPTGTGAVFEVRLPGASAGGATNPAAAPTLAGTAPQA